jgi:hypothetical protein
MRTRAYRRHQRARIKARHLRDYYELNPWSARNSEAAGFGPPKDIAIRHPLDCGRRCYLCHYQKLWGLPRLRERDWQRFEDVAW